MRGGGTPGGIERGGGGNKKKKKGRGGRDVTRDVKPRRSKALLVGPYETSIRQAATLFSLKPVDGPFSAFALEKPPLQKSLIARIQSAQSTTVDLARLPLAFKRFNDPRKGETQVAGARPNLGFYTLQARIRVTERPTGCALHMRIILASRCACCRRWRWCCWCCCFCRRPARPCLVVREGCADKRATLGSARHSRKAKRVPAVSTPEQQQEPLPLPSPSVPSPPGAFFSS